MPRITHEVLSSGEESWPEPKPLETRELLPVQAFDVEWLPESLRPLIVDVAERMQVVPDLPAVVMIAALAGAVGRRCMIQPKALDTSWVVVPNLWGALVAPSGKLKSPLIQAVLKPLRRIEDSLQQENCRESAEYLAALAKWKESSKADSSKQKPLPPSAKRIIVNDATFETLHEINCANPAGLFVDRDELSGMLALMDRDGREGERAFYLSGWNGDTPHKIDRMGRVGGYCPAVCLSMLGGIQPDLLRSYVAGTHGTPLATDGFLQRFQLLCYPDDDLNYVYVDRPPDEAALRQAERLFTRLTEIDPASPLLFKFDGEAQELFAVWLEDLELRLRSADLPPMMKSHLSKYRSLFPSLALLFQLAENASKAAKVRKPIGNGSSVGSVSLFPPPHVVSLENTTLALRWCGYLESHARRVYGLYESSDLQSAQRLALKILDGTLVDSFHPRDVERHNWSGLKTSRAVDVACRSLERANWIKKSATQPGKRGGRPSTLFTINPRVCEIPPQSKNED